MPLRAAAAIVAVTMVAVSTMIAKDTDMLRRSNRLLDGCGDLHTMQIVPAETQTSGITRRNGTRNSLGSEPRGC